MNKETLANYGWLVVITLVLAVMLAFTSPFGMYVSDAVINTVRAYRTASDKSFDKIEETSAEMEDKLFEGYDTNEMVAGIRFSKRLIDVNCHDAVYSHTSSCFESVDVFLTWDELILEENAKKYLYYHNAIKSTEISGMPFDVPPSGTSVIEIVIPKSVTKISDTALMTAPIQKISYCGTMAEWESIDKDGWNKYLTISEVHCSDGIVEVEPYDWD